ncbi:MAG: hypothetical protein ACRBDL_11210 [Alphaproteobacteria bacterium]
MKNLLICLSCVILLCSCVTRDQADKRLEAGCRAAAEMFIDSDFFVKKIKRVTSKPSAEFGAGYRDITIFAVESDNWLDLDKEYKCTFAEEFGLLNATYQASLYQVHVNDKTYGKKGDQILGDIEDHLKLVKAVQDAMRP